MRRKDFLQTPITHMQVKKKLTVDQLIRQFEKAGSFGAGRISAACNIYEQMIRDEECTIYLALAGAMVPAGMRSVIADLIRLNLIDVVVSTGANMVHDAIEALGGHHYKGSWQVDDNILYKYHIFRIFDVFVPEEDFVKLDYKLVEIYDEISEECNGRSLSSNEFAWELGKRLHDSDSILKAAYEKQVPIFLPAIRDSEFGYAYWLHASRIGTHSILQIDAFKDVPEIVRLCKQSPRNGMIVLGGGVPRNTVQSAALASKKGMDYAIVITMDRPEIGGLSGSTLGETVSWGKVKHSAEKCSVIGDAMIIFPIIVASVVERLGDKFKRMRSNYSLRAE